MDNRQVYDRLYNHALENYTNGWDYFVECCGFSDFCDAVVRHGWNTYEEAADYYQQIYSCLSARREEMTAEIF
jgi:hypothetical protein